VADKLVMVTLSLATPMALISGLPGGVTAEAPPPVADEFASPVEDEV
jgi:hypothetical protein